MPKRFYDGLDDNIRKVLLAQIRNLWTHESTAIEGNTLTLGDTAFVLEEGLTVSGKPLKDHREVYDHAKAIELIYSFLDIDTLCADNIFALHRAILTESVMDIYCPIGNWKNEPNYTTFIGSDGRQSTREYPAPQHIARMMEQWLQRFNSMYRDDLSMSDATRAYAKLHLDFVTIHPFYDGNGRMARLLANLPALKSGFPPIVVPSAKRQEYRDVISSYQESIQNLDRLNDLSLLPESKEFRALCAGYWGETMRLIDEAHQLQEKKSRSCPGSECSVVTNESTQCEVEHGSFRNRP